MSSEKPDPYLFTDAIGGMNLLHIPVIEQDDELRQTLVKIGLKRQIGMTRDGQTVFKRPDGNTISYISWEVVKITPYTTALHAIGEEENTGSIPVGSYGEALELMLNGQFEDSGWASRYLPGEAE